MLFYVKKYIWLELVVTVLLAGIGYGGICYFHLPITLSFTWCAIAQVVASFLVISGWTFLIQKGYALIKGEHYAQALTESLAVHYAGGSILQAIAGGITAACGEELFFRGFIQGRWGIGASTLMFGFRPRPQSFLHITNTKYVQNIVDAALSAGVRKFILISFPHVEGETSPEAPARGQLDAHSTTLHSQTRLAAEQYLFRACEGTAMKPLVLRVGVIYGRDVKLIEAARSLMRMRLFAIWRRPTWVHLLALPDFLRIVEIGIEKDDLCGIFNVCDDHPMLLQDFLDEIAAHWGFKAPIRLPTFAFYWSAILCETFATIFHTNTPLTRDIVTMGMTSVVADTSRMKSEISTMLLFPTLKQGLAII